MEHGGDHTTIEQRVNAAERARKVFELIKLGASYAAAGKEVGMTASAARRAFLRVLHRVPVADAREWRQVQIERYNAALMEINVYQMTHPERVIECVNAKVRILNGVNEILGIKRLVLKVEEEGAEQVERLTLAGLRIVWESLEKQKREQEAVDVAAEEIGDGVTKTEGEPNDYVQPTIEDLRKAGRNRNG
jgi:hypothetical protein